MNEIRITLPPPAKCLSPNARSHYMMKANATKAYRCDTAYKARAALGRAKPPKWKRATVQLTFRVLTNRRRDADNALASMKAAFDGLRDAGVIEDDSGLVHLPVQWEVDRSRMPVVEVVVKEV